MGTQRTIHPRYFYVTCEEAIKFARLYYHTRLNGTGPYKDIHLFFYPDEDGMYCQLEFSDSEYNLKINVYALEALVSSTFNDTPPF